MDKVKEHFEDEAEEFDTTILNLIPRYNEMIDVMVSAIPFETSETFRVLDLGCGTGNISNVIKIKYPNAIVTCIDIADKMIEMAKIKLKEHHDIEYYTGDFTEFDFKENYDVIVSSLAIHHLKTDENKKDFYGRIHDALKHGGVFLNSDVVLGSSEFLIDLYQRKWIEFMLQNVPKKVVEEKWLHKQKEEDFPTTLINHMQWLDSIGFINIDVVWKYYGLAVYCGKRK